MSLEATATGHPHPTGVGIGAAPRGSPSGYRLFRQCFEMTRHPLTASGGPKLRLLRPAAIEYEWTSGVKTASAGWIDRARHVALEDHRGSGGPRVRDGHTGEQ